MIDILMSWVSRDGWLQSRLFLLLKRLTEKLGIRVIPLSESLIDMEDVFRGIYEECRAFTESTPERMYALYRAVDYIVSSRTPGDLVESGVWKGGSCMLMARTLILKGDTDRRIFLYDTFAGMTEPTAEDYFLKDGRKAADMWKPDGESGHGRWLSASLEEVRENVRSTGYPEEKLVFVEGRNEDTVPGTVPEEIALLRLDTDWYESTRHEMSHLYPLVGEGGVLLVDDYGVWAGARKAVDEYFGQQGISMLLDRIDYTGRIGVKVSPTCQPEDPSGLT